MKTQLKIDQFIYLPEFQVIIYKKCKYTVLSSQIDSYFTPKRPHRYTKQERQRIANQVIEISGLRQDEEALK